MNINKRRFFGFAVAAALAAVPLSSVGHSLAAFAQDKQAQQSDANGNAKSTKTTESDREDNGKNGSTGSESADTTDSGSADSTGSEANSTDSGTAGSTSSESTASTESQTANNDESTSDGLPEARDPAQDAVEGRTITQSGNTALDHYDLAHFYFSQWQLNLASVEYEVAIMYSPNMKIAHRDYCVVSLLNGHPIKAFAEAMVVIGLGEPIPLNATEIAELTQRASKIHYKKALEYARNSKWDNAIAELQWALTYTPDKPSVVRSLAFCYASKGDFSKAEQEYNKNFALDPDDAFSHADFANLLEEHGQNSRAEGQVAKAIRIAPRVAALHVDMGWIAETKGDFPAAQQEFEKAIKLCPKQPGLWLQLGKVLERSGKAEQAKGAYAQVLALDASEEEAKQRLDALNAKNPAAVQPAKRPS